MKNIYLIPTDKLSRLYEFGGQFILTHELTDAFRNYHIYITSDEEIKESDWFIQVNTNKVIKEHPNNGLLVRPQIFDKKIILTTDQDLIADGVQAIDDTFLEWFVKNPSCEFVKIKVEVYPCDSRGNEIIFSQPANLGGSEDYRNNIKTFIKQEHLDNKNFIKAYDKKRYKIIIPQEEPKQTDENGKPLTYWGGLEESKQDFIVGAKWQAEKMYSEEEVIAIVEKSRETGLTAEYLLLTEQFKKN